jgi:predicted DNA-binding ribbon-helix-helix protein
VNHHETNAHLSRGVDFLRVDPLRTSSARKEIAALKKTSVARLVPSIDTERDGANRSSALRLFVLRYYRG